MTNSSSTINDLIHKKVFKNLSFEQDFWILSCIRKLVEIINKLGQNNVKNIASTYIKPSKPEDKIVF